MANTLRQSYTRLDSTTDVTDTKNENLILGIQEIPLVHLDPSNSKSLFFEDTKCYSSDPISQHSPRSKWNRYRLTGWRVGAGIAMAGALLTLLANIGIAVYGMKHRNPGSSGSTILVELFHGDCEKAASINTYVHLLINVISTLLLSGSNFYEVAGYWRAFYSQFATSEPWEEVSMGDADHLIIAFALDVQLEDFTTGANFSTANGFNTGALQPPWYKEDLKEVQRQVQAGRFERLENIDCLKAYAVDLVTDRRTLVVVSSNFSKHDNGAVLGSGNQEYVKPERWYTLEEQYDPYTWLCGNRDAAAVGFNRDQVYYPYCYKYVDRLIAHPDKWAPSDWTPQYCLSEKVGGQCSGFVNLAIIWIVIACNIIKMIVMAIVAFSTTLDQPLCTIGDAIASFVTVPDPTTENMCITTRAYMRLYEESLKESNQAYRQETFGQDPNLHHLLSGKSGWTPPNPQTWHVDSGLRWYHASSKPRWCWGILFYLACLVTTLGLLGRAIGFYTGDRSLSALANLGLGHPNSQTMINGWAISAMENKAAAIVLSVLVANTPQIVLSLLYFSVNGISTCMALASEWGKFSYENAVRNGAKTLRTSEPQGKQRSTYFLQLPFRFAIPLILMSALLHWLISQSIFISVVTIYDELGSLKEDFAVTTCGFSPFAMILVIIAGLGLAGGITGISCFKLDPGMRLVGSSSAAISAACHMKQLRAAERWELIRGPVVWGDVGIEGNGENMKFVGSLEDEVRHCTFVSAAEQGWEARAVSPMEGMKYA